MVGVNLSCVQCADGFFTLRSGGANTIVYLDTADGAHSRALLLVKNTGGSWVVAISSHEFSVLAG